MEGESCRIVGCISASKSLVKQQLLRRKKGTGPQNMYTPVKGEALFPALPPPGDSIFLGLSPSP